MVSIVERQTGVDEVVFERKIEEWRRGMPWEMYELGKDFHDCVEFLRERLCSRHELQPYQCTARWPIRAAILNWGNNAIPDLDGLGRRRPL
jgi:hypothetical protein